MTFDALSHLLDTQRSQGATRILVPIARRLSADLLTPVSAFLALRRNATYPFLLESVEGGEQVARYSFIGRNPYRTVEVKGTHVTVTTDEGTSASDGDFFETMRGFLTSHVEVRPPDLPRFTGGAVGFLAYDAVRLVEHLPDAPPDDLGVPDGRWCFYKTCVAFDHVRHQVVLMAHLFIEPHTDVRAAYDAAQADLDGLAEDLHRPLDGLPEPVVVPGGALASNLTPEAFAEAVEKARRHIYEGDIFQVVLSQRFSTPFSGDPFNVYRALRQVNPSPYLFFLDFGDLTVVGSSPEVLVRVEDGRAELLPIAGTRPRGANPEEDAALESELLADAKERAEHLMLVDLGRNDLGRIAAYGSVEVERYAFVEKYSHVMHIVSSVAAQVRDGMHAVDVLAACFPAGTLSGAPKVRAMEIIDALEPTRRGLYGGAVGYFDFSGNLDTCIAIRTVLVKDGVLYMQAGAGIVADSDADMEYRETVNKAQALREAVAVASRWLF